MILTAVDHITINCIDVTASRRFYEQIFELPRLNDVDLGDHILHYYQLPGVKLELIEYLTPQKIWQTGHTDTGIYRHFAVCVDHLETIHSRCQGNVKINLQPTFIPQLGKTVMLIQDPNGVEIEVIQA